MAFCQIEFSDKKISDIWNHWRFKYFDSFTGLQSDLQ